MIPAISSTSREYITVELDKINKGFHIEKPNFCNVNI